MKHHNAPLENLTRSSLRLNKGMMILLGLTLLLIGISAWSVRRLIEEHHDTVSFHFARLLENIQEQEDFLQSLTHYSLEGDLLNNDLPKVRLFTPLPDEGADIYQGQAFSFSMPFSVKLDPQTIPASEQPKVLGLGASLADIYSTFWSASYYRSPQVFLFNPQGNYDITVPAAGRGRSKVMSVNENFADVFKTVIARFPQGNPLQGHAEIAWKSYVESPDPSTPARMLAYVNLQLKPEQLHIQGAGSQVIIASLVDLNQINDFERIMNWSEYDHLTLIDPTGTVLIGVLGPESQLKEGFNLKPEGLVFKLVNHEGPAWTAIYTVGFTSFFRNALWSLVSLAFVLLGTLGLSWLATRWYKRHVILPARIAHSNIAESEAFSRVVIDTAPTGLCVVRRTDQKILVENQRAQQWHYTGELVKALAHHRDSCEIGEHSLEIDGHHLEVGFVSTRYQGQDVRLYAFNDVTRHIDDAHALEQARRAADAANEAKTLFLATMSHEIRTPLYGVLGTLELLGLTRLDPRQYDYLQTIQRSSTTLFQLISDVLDVSKIESGQMAIEPVEFSPLEMIEDTVHTYAAFAQRKGLMLYACTDAKLPDRVLGDPMRIRQILNNLVSNAIKFTDTGRVVLRTRVLQISEQEVSFEWQVTDTGIGISESQQANLFDLFFQVKDSSSEGGAGLGLPICRWLSEMMGGQMKVVSEPGLGSSFSLLMSLPVLSANAAQGAGIVSGSTPVHVRAPIQELAQTHCDWLNRLGVVATLAALPQEHKHADIVLLDVLPGNDEQPWGGPRVCCISGGPNPAQYIDGRWEVDVHDVHAIAQAVSLARQNKTEQASHVPAQRGADLMLHILVAEDNPINQAILKEQLDALGCTAVVAANGELAMHTWQPKVFDLVITDVNMPVMNGYEFAKALREHDAKVPIIGVTANAMREEGARCIAAGMNAWIVKPMGLQTLRENLVKLCKPATYDCRGRNASAPLDPSPPPSPADQVHLSPAMRALFISTMQEDMQQISAGLEERSGAKVGQRLHRVAGALSVVQARDLAEYCTHLEIQVAETDFDAALQQKVEQVLVRLCAILRSLEGD